MENKRTIIAIVLIAVIWLFFNNFISSEKSENPQVVSEPVTESQKIPQKNLIDNSTAKSVKLPVFSDISLPAQKNYSFSSPLYKITFSSIGAGIVKYELNNYKQENRKDSNNVNVIDLSDTIGSFIFTGSDIDTNLKYNLVSNVDRNFIDKETKIIFVAEFENKYKIVKKFIFYPDDYAFDLEISVQNTNSTETSGIFSLNLITPWSKEKNSDRYSFIGPVSYVDDKLHEDNPKDLIDESVSYSPTSFWTSFSYKYFATIVKPFGNAAKSLDVIYDPKKTLVYNKISAEKLFLTPGETVTYKYRAYVGPRNYDLLSKYDLSFEKIINLGFFGLIAHPLLVALNFFHNYLGNYGFAIVLLTICIKAVFWPLTQKSYSSMKDMQKLQPQMQKLRSKYGKDKQKLNQEMMSLYKENRVNPFGGCLPMLVQIPVFFALYKVLLDAIELRHAPFIFWITDLSAPDTLISDALNLGFVLGPLPLIMGFTMFLQQKMAPTNMDPTQAKIMLFMPVFFTFIFLSFPSGLVVYWLVNNILTIAQQYFINRK